MVVIVMIIYQLVSILICISEGGERGHNEYNHSCLGACMYHLKDALCLEDVGSLI